MKTAYLTGLIAAGVSQLAVVGRIPVARKIRLLDSPDHRKNYEGSVPLTGGISVFTGLLVAWVAAMPLRHAFGIYLLCSLMLVMLGAIDDVRKFVWFRYYRTCRAGSSGNHCGGYRGEQCLQYG